MPKLVDDPLVRTCRECGQVRKHRARSDTGRPQSRCPGCMSAYLKEWRSRNWQRAKARHTWKDMIRRCHDERHGSNCPPGIPRYSEYGGRGVRVCKRWRSGSGFRLFLEDLGLPPERDSTLDRRNPRRNYTPSNCRWVDPRTQQLNKRGIHWLLARDPRTGEEVEDHLTGWSRRTGVKRRTIQKRLARGWDPSDAVGLAPLALGQRWIHEEVPF